MTFAQLRPTAHYFVLIPTILQRRCGKATGHPSNAMLIIIFSHYTYFQKDLTNTNYLSTNNFFQAHHSMNTTNKRSGTQDLGGDTCKRPDQTASPKKKTAAATKKKADALTLHKLQT